MAFKLSSKAQAATAQTGGGGGYLSPSKVPSGGSVRFHILSPEPLEYYTVWGESAEGQLKPFRFIDDPSPSDIKSELGEFNRRMNREGTAPEAPRFGLSFFVWNYDTEAVQCCEFSQKSLIRELDQITQMEDYEDLSDWDFILSKEGTGLTTEYTLRPAPVKKASATERKAAWSEAQEKGYDLKALLVGESPFGS